jgi:pyruvate dehydrogenase E1 component alpha subunit
MAKRALITESDVQRVIMEGGRTLRVDGDPIITPLAASSIKENNIQIVRGGSALNTGAQTAMSGCIAQIGCPDEPIDISGRDRGFLLKLYTSMLKVRNFEEAMGVLFREKHLVGFLHLSIGQEAVAVGTCSALNQDDYLTLTHRGHGQMVAKGSDLKRMAAELLGKETGYCKGKGGSVHLADFSQGILGANGVIGAGIVIATGAAMSIKIQKTNQIAVSFLGDGQVNQGAFHEGMNYAAVRKLPVLFVCENNQYAVSTSSEKSMSSESIAARAAAYGMDACSIDGMNVLLVYDTIQKAAEKARNGGGPSFIECMTYRYHGHWEGETTDLRPVEEKEKWRKRDPIIRLEKSLTMQKSASAEELGEIKNDVINQVADAVRFAEQSPFPDISETTKGIYSSEAGAQCVR